MAKTATLILLLCYSLLFSQPVINKSIFTASPERTIQYYSFLTPSFSPGPSGQNTTWDFRFSNFNSNTVYTMTIGATDDSTAKVFPGSNVSEYNSTYGEYAYYNSSDFSYQKKGSSGPPGFTLYKDPRELARFPLTYLTAFADSFSFTSQFTFMTTKSIGKTSCVCDGYGTLKLPTTSYTNVLRLVCNDTSSEVMEGSGTPALYTRIETSYYWLQEMVSYPILSATFSYSPNNITKVLVTSLKSILTGNSNYAKNSSAFAIYPNPISKNKSTLNISVGNPGLYEITLTSSGGIAVSKRIELLINGNNEISVWDDNIEKGLYFLNLKSNEQVYLTKLLIE